MAIFRKVTLLLGMLLITWYGETFAGDEPEVSLDLVQLSKGVHVLYGQGGNIGVFTGPEGTFMIDGQFADLSQRILEEVRKTGAEGIDFLLNTHWHYDHTGGNVNFHAAGAVLISHENVRDYLSMDSRVEFFDRVVPALPPEGLPVITFRDGMTLHLNGETIEIHHVEHAHTNGDALVHFREANVVHMGDIYFSGIYPFIDLGSKGGIRGVIQGCDLVLQVANEETRIIPGHGKVTGIAELREYRNMLESVYRTVSSARAEGKSLDEVIAMKPTAEYDEQFGGGFIKPDDFVLFVYYSLE